jgi:hypothetical protein
MYAPPAGSLDDGPTSFQVHASDTFGVASVQFTIDGAPAGPLLTSPDAPALYLYSTTFDTSTLAPGSHVVSAHVIDGAGNSTDAAGVQIVAGPIDVVPVINYHGIIGPLDTSPDTTDQTAAQASEELAYLHDNGYQSLTLEQYQTWLDTGTLPDGVTKPVLLTVDDGLADELAWDPLLQQYGLTAVLFVVTGFADNTAPGSDDPVHNLSWSQLQALAANGRWELAFHAGADGRASFDSTGTTIDLGAGQTLSYGAGCWSYYTCLGTVTTTVGTGASQVVTTAPETPQQFEQLIAAEIDAGIAELKQNVPGASSAAWACPWNACGQWANQYDDPTSTVQGWLPGYLASRFPIVFMQTDPADYGQAPGTVGALDGLARRYRFEVDTSTTLAQFVAQLTDLGFAR